MDYTIDFSTDQFIANFLKWCHTIYNSILSMVEPLFTFLGSELTIGDITLSFGYVIFGAGFITLIAFMLIKFVLS